MISRHAARSPRRRARGIRRNTKLKSSTKILIGILAVLALAILLFVIIFSTTRAEEVRSGRFYDMLLSGNIRDGSMSVSGDTVSFASGDRRYTVTLYSESDYYSMFADYDVAVDKAKEISEEIKDTSPETPENEDAQSAWEAFTGTTDASSTGGDGQLAEYGIDDPRVIAALKGSSYSDWAGFSKTDVLYSDRYAVSIFDYIYPVAMLGIMIVFIVILFRSMRGGGGVANDFGKSKANVQSSLKVRFSDVAGAEEEKEELQEIVEFLKTPGKFAGVGARVPKGVLLVGPPGTGKTLFAKAVAGEANVPFFSISGSDFVEMYVGVGACATGSRRRRRISPA